MNLLLCLILISQASAMLTLHFNGSTIDYYAVSAGFPRSNPNGLISWNSPVSLPTPADACNSITNQVLGTVIIVMPGNCYPVIKARNAQIAGAIGVIVFSYSGSIGGVRYINLNDEEGDVTLPMVEVSLTDQASLMAVITMQAVNVTVTLDPNPYDLFYSSSGWLAYSIIIGLVNLGLVLFSGYRIYGFLKVKRPYVGFYTYLLINLSSLMRVISLLDPNGYYGFIPRGARGFFFGFPLVFNIAASITTAFYWAEVFDEEKLQTNLTGLTRFKWPCLLVIIAISALDLVQVTLGIILITSPIVSYVSGVFNTICNVAVFIFFAYSCHLIRVYVKHNAQLSQTIHLLFRLFILGMIQCVCLIGYFAVGALFATPIAVDFRYSAIFSALLNIIVTILAISQSLMFSDPLRQATPIYDLPTRSRVSSTFEEKTMENYEASTRSEYEASEEVTLP